MIQCNYFVLKTDFTCPASTSKSQSSRSSMSLRHEQGLTPLPFNQCWNISRQHSSGSLLFLVLIASNFEPNSSNANWSPSALHFDASAAIILIFFPSAVFNIDKFLRVGVASVLIRACNHTLKLIELQFLTNGSLWKWYCRTIGTRFPTFKTCFSYSDNECTWV